MNNEFIPFEQALDLKELGFDEPCIAHFVKHDDEIKCILDSDDFDEWWTNNSDNLQVKAPLYQQAFRWFRDKYNLHNGIYPYYDEYEFQIKDFRLSTNTPINGGLMKYEEAELACLDKLIEIVKSK
jgi:hypothetical protein